ncbi:MAG TPA: AAA family ATPase [Candidatus Manganitrophaceae bacterium]|nr:AAA family ATPase [Candidatus Manganitrophaceae bacterium]
MEGDLTLHQTQGEIKKLNQVVEKVTAPANRIGTLLGVPAPELAHIVVGGSDYYTNIDPRLDPKELLVGTQVLVNEAFVVLKTIGYDRNGSVVKIVDLLPDGRLRVGQEPGTQSNLLIRSAQLADVKLNVNDEVRIDASHRVAIEKVDQAKRREYFLEETPKVTWEEIGGQKEAIESIREALEHPLLYPDLFKKYNFSQPKGFLLYGPPGCGKTLIGKATAYSLVQKLKAQGNEQVEEFFLHIKGPEILNMWLGESERMVREIFARAREKRGNGYLPFIFIDEAESILGTRRSSRSHNILSTLVPMFCAEMDGIESLKEMVIILASNRPDLIDPAVLRPGRIDRKIKIRRPDRSGAEEILKVYLTDAMPLSPGLLKAHRNDPAQARQALLDAALDAIFSKAPGQQILELQLRSSRREILYRSDLISGALLASIVQRAKERAIKRTIAGGEEGLDLSDLTAAVENEFKEGEMLPPNDIAEDWLKLIDVDPENVVGLSLFDKREKSRPEKRVI